MVSPKLCVFLLPCRPVYPLSWRAELSGIHNASASWGHTISSTSAGLSVKFPLSTLAIFSDPEVVLNWLSQLLILRWLCQCVNLLYVQIYFVINNVVQLYVFSLAHRSITIQRHIVMTNFVIRSMKPLLSSSLI